MPPVLLVSIFLALGGAAASGLAAGARELVHAYPPIGPVDVAGVAVSNKVLRTLQPHAVPAFTDVLAMHVAQTLQGASDQPFTVTRRLKAGGHDAAATVSSAAADGRTLLLADDILSHSTAGARTGMRGAALQPVALVASMPSVFIAASGSRERLDEIIRAPARLLVGSAGERSTGHLAIERLRSRQGASIEPVAYNGGISAMHAVATQQVSIALIPLPAVLPYLGAGRVRMLALAELRRHPAIPDVPTTAQAGLTDFEASGWFGVFAPAGTPRSVIRALDAALVNGPKSGQTRQVFSEYGLRLEHHSADAFAARLAEERRRWGSSS